MRKISITPEIEKLVEKKYWNILHASEINQKILVDLALLRDEFSNARRIEINTSKSKNPNWVLSLSTALQYVEYIDEILRDYRSGKLLIWKPTMFCGDIKHKDTYVHHQIVNYAMRVDGNNRDSFAYRLVKALHYDDVRKLIVPPIYRELEMKSCVYCNANYTISDENGEGYYDLDHWKPKSSYPFLCISFFNLQPSCPSCNRRKSSSDIQFFGLWDDTGNRDLDVLKFKLDEASLVNYLVFLEREKLKVELIEANPWSQTHQEIRKNTEERLHIEARYAEHNDYTEEIVWKSKIYNPSMIQSLRDSKFSALIPNQVDLERFILGTYSAPDDIHKRPLTRLAIDVAQQLGLMCNSNII